MSENMTDHEYDGIRELDNRLPRWWLGTFYATIVFALGYYAYYQLGPGPTLEQEHAQALARIEAAKASAPEAGGTFSDEELVKLASLTDRVSLGKSAFAAKCAACHGQQGQGSIGPNLTDEYWLHGGRPSEIAKVVSDGVLDKGMPPWKAMMAPDELLNVVAYIHTLRGTNPPNPKAPQGEKVTLQ